MFQFQFFKKANKFQDKVRTSTDGDDGGIN